MLSHQALSLSATLVAASLPTFNLYLSLSFPLPSNQSSLALSVSREHSRLYSPLSLIWIGVRDYKYAMRVSVRKGACVRVCVSVCGVSVRQWVFLLFFNSRVFLQLARSRRQKNPLFSPFIKKASIWLEATNEKGFISYWSKSELAAAAASPCCVIPSSDRGGKSSGLGSMARDKLEVHFKWAPNSELKKPHFKKAQNRLKPVD